jgi:hypothetical protein
MRQEAQSAQSRAPRRCEEEQMSCVRNVRGRGRLLVAAFASVIGMACFVSSAAAAPVWRIDSLSNTTAAPGGELTYMVQVENVGDTPAPATPGGDAGNCTPGSPPPSIEANCYTVRAGFPPGLTGVRAEIFSTFGAVSCTVSADNITCPFQGDTLADQVATTTDRAYRTILFTTAVDPGASGVLTSSFEVSGGGGATATTVDPTQITADPPAFGIDAFDAQVTANAAGDPLTQAAGHPYEATTTIVFNSFTDPASLTGMLTPVESTRDVIVNLPPGFVGDPSVVDKCAPSDLANSVGLEMRALCSPTSQVGTTMVQLNGGGQQAVIGPVPLFNIDPPPGVPAELGFNVFGTVVTIAVSPRTESDYGLTARVRYVSELAIQGTTLTLWGVPSDPVHRNERACPGELIPQRGGATCASGSAPKAFLRNPTSCSEPGVGLLTTAQIDSWEHPGDFEQASFRSHLPPGFPADPSQWGPEQGTDGCNRVPFDPTLEAQPPAGTTAGGPSGFAVDIDLPQTNDPATIATGDLKKAVVTLPEGVRVNPSSADGLQACSPGQIGLHSDSVPTCPDGSKLGAVTIDTPLLDVPVTGSLYLATPFDNPFRSLVSLYLVASAKGVTIKQPGQVQLDPVTGRITTTFDENPQLPFSRLHVELNGGPRSPLAIPNRCGTYTTHAALTSWSGKTVEQDSSFTLARNARGEPCPVVFAPGFRAATRSNSAGKSSSFLLRLTRSDDDQEFQALSVHLPRGLTGRIADVPLCGSTEAAAGTCPESSRIGSVTVGAGAGSNPFYISSGRAYLTGPYKGAPFGVSIVVPAVAGPFDLGTVTVRSALFVDKQDASVRIVSDPFPTILQGIPLGVRDVRVNVDKLGFFLNPTSCAVKTISGTLTSTAGASAGVSDRYQAADCASLGFVPSMTMRVGGRGHTRRGQTSPFSTTLTMPQRDQANLRFVRVTLPDTINARLNTIQDACTRAEFESDVAKCAHAKAGTASASTPLLRAPLKGNVYFVKNGHAIPDLFVALRGQVSFDLVGRITIVDNKLLRTTFETAPDVPIRSFKLSLLGGAKTASIGALANLCSAKSRRAKAEVDYIAQNGKVKQVDQALKVAGCGKQKKARHGRHR